MLNLIPYSTFRAKKDHNRERVQRAQKEEKEENGKNEECRPRSSMIEEERTRLLSRDQENAVDPV